MKGAAPRAGLAGHGGRVVAGAAGGTGGGAPAPAPEPAARGGGGGPSGPVITIPTYLTLARIAAVPALMGAYFAAPPLGSAALCTAIFVAAALTDWLDGYLARRLNAFSAFGAFLDPVADKLMVTAVLVMLCARPPAAGPAALNPLVLAAPAVVIIGREVAMASLREWAATAGGGAADAVKVSSLGKWKTAAQMSALTLLLACRDGGSGALFDAGLVAGPVLLYVSAALTLVSFVDYLRGALKAMA